MFGGEPLPAIFQVFGQRFVLDSFLMSKLVFDSITWKGKAMNRRMPTGLDVMASLGNDLAVTLLESELRTYRYATNLLAARRTVEARPPETWTSSAYHSWLRALAALHETPQGRFAPAAMQGAAWRHKQLQTQLASWAELRHDTILYAKQSYTAAICEYPEGYVEPYPKVFARIAGLVEATRRFLKMCDALDARTTPFLDHFVATVRRLERLAEKELAGEPFDADERTFLKDTISRKWRDGGCAPTAEYDGWYATLFFDHHPDLWTPTIADVHTDPQGGQVLEVGVGPAQYLVVAVDNGPDRAVYVGPAHTYFEFPSGKRLTDEEWLTELRAGRAPARPAWTRVFQGARAERRIAPKAR